MLEQIKKTIYEAKGKRESFRSEYLDSKRNLKKYEKRLKRIEKAQTIIQLVAEQTQKQLEYSLSEIVSLALGIVFDDPYELALDFTPIKGKTECKIKLVKDGQEFDPMFSAGGGIGNVAANSLRCAVLSVSQPRVRNILILDEPFPGLKGKKANEKALQMLKTISEELDDMQIIMVSDERVDREIIIENADKVFETKLVNEVTKIKEVSK